MRAAVAIFGLLLLCGCATETPLPDQPTMYVNMAAPGAVLDQQAAAIMISQYRQNNGLGLVVVDPGLMKLAEEQSRAMVTRDKLDHNVIRDFGERLQVAGYKSKVAAENIGAGYHTLAEAFSGWRDSPPHRRNMLLDGASRIGIAAAYSPKSKYRVFWALLLAG